MRIKTWFLLTVLGSSGALLLSGCKYDTDIAHPEAYASIYMPEAARSPIACNFIMSDSAQTIIYGASFGGTDYPAHDITVHFAVDPSLADSFNLANGTDYPAMPEGSYTLQEASAVIPKGKLSTEPLEAKIKTIGAIDPSTKYLLGIRVMDAGDVKIGLGTTYYLIQGVYEVVADSAYSSYDRTGWEVVDFDSQEAVGEGPNNGRAVFAIDGDTTTYWHTKWKNGKAYPPHWITIKMDTTHIIHGFYFWPRANEVASGGNPQNIHIDISQDSTTWKSLGDFVLQNAEGRQNLYLPFGLPARYFKITITQSYTGVYKTYIAEVGTF